ncbi:MAG: enoyl-CoA hydratase/isomerase family protein [Candidatus Binatia bacterium]|nr:enoyl-CoA hydratase/isomerase family protein [Candidatus Binatia bacterium]
MYEHLKVIRSEEGIVTIALNRPETRNSMTPAMGEELARVVGELREDRSVRVVVLRGEGKAFSSGGDLGMLARDTGLLSGTEGPTMAGSPREFYDRYLSIVRLPMPTIAAINGHAVGAGACLALACDLRIASRAAKIGFTFTRLGIHPGMGATYFLPRLVGTSRACDLLFSGRIVDAEEAYRLGLVDRIATPEDFETQVAAWAKEMASAGPLAVRLTKRAIYRGIRHTLEEMLDFESLQQSWTFTSEDAREGVQAMLEKREPRFHGR